jgi:hypothetical protein
VPRLPAATDEVSCQSPSTVQRAAARRRIARFRTLLLLLLLLCPSLPLPSPLLLFAGEDGERNGDALAEVEADEGFEEERSGSADALDAFGSSAEERFRCLEEDLGRARPRAPAEDPRISVICSAAAPKGKARAAREGRKRPLLGGRHRKKEGRRRFEEERWCLLRSGGKPEVRRSLATQGASVRCSMSRGLKDVRVARSPSGGAVERDWFVPTGKAR